MNIWMRTIFLIAVMAWGAVGAQAATMTVDWGRTYDYRTASSVPSVDGGRTRTETVTQFNLTFDDNFSTFGFCVAPTISIGQDSYAYSVRDWTPDYLQAAWLMDTYAPDASTINTKGETVGLQSAIWAAVTDNANYKPYYNTNSQRTFYENWYSSLPQSLDDATILALETEYKVIQAYSATNQLKQTLIVRYPSPVPVPAAVWMLGTALAGLLGLRWRHRA